MLKKRVDAVAVTGILNIKNMSLTTLRHDLFMTVLNKNGNDDPWMTELNASSNAMKELPDWIWKWKALQHVQKIDLRRNRLRTLDDSLATLTHLRSLLLSRNQLIDLPLSISTLVQLQELDVSYNALVGIPLAIYCLPRLGRLVLFGNPIPEKEVLEIQAATQHLKTRKQTTFKTDSITSTLKQSLQHLNISIN